MDLNNQAFNNYVESKILNFMGTHPKNTHGIQAQTQPNPYLIFGLGLGINLGYLNFWYPIFTLCCRPNVSQFWPPHSPRVDANGDFIYYLHFVTWPPVDFLLTPTSPIFVHVVIESPLKQKKKKLQKCFFLQFMLCLKNTIWYCTHQRKMFKDCIS